MRVNFVKNRYYFLLLFLAPLYLLARLIPQLIHAVFVCLGRNSNIMHKFTVFGKAGIRRNYGSRPIVRGVARNPVDHPNGGRTKTNKPEKSL